MHIQQIEEARALAPVVPRNLAAVDTDPMMVVQYVPNLGTGGTSASISLAAKAGEMVFLVDSAAPAGLDAIGDGGALTLTAASYLLMGQLVDYINTRLAWRAYLVAALRADSSSCLLIKAVGGGTPCSTDNGYTFLGESAGWTGASSILGNSISLAISGEKFVSNGINGHVTDDADEVENSLLYGSFNVTAASAGMLLKYYSGKQGSTEVQLGSSITVLTATQKEQGEANWDGTFIKAVRGERLIIRVNNHSAGALSAPAIETLGKSVVLKNDRIVDEDNY